ncbi:phage tail sheath family protein [Polymorphobacter fuscus]|uniref:Phage tail sheath family protein n=1 Tax=Sandarakinorhabdus fusca TaxID=1439888 RepID=A0A7C9KX87_9SPHN|nr:phage tail sheath C-terminal domain-containing protein [Polymorphobacter fuscus]KAB7647954.1 phage tail sheath family protein [Polymorphobacter fuscus]MQT17282.1 phage tail sheath family protein [Polymorphobacter fuscus]NJC08721.1 hypothetical protein [Polymorphobacter fuscus]
MPAVLTYPGVYIEETASGVRSIAGVATSIAAFVGRTRRGPTNEPIVINSYGDFERRFGGLWVASPLSFAVRDFYLNGGGTAIIVRLFHPQFADAAARTAALAAATTEAQTGADLVAAAATTAAGAGGATAAGVAAAAQTAAGTAVGTSGLAAGNAVAAAAAAAAAAPAATPATVSAAATGAVADAVTAAAASAAPVTAASIDANGLSLEAASPGDWGNLLRARIDHDVAVDPANPAAATMMFNLTVRDGQTGEVEVHRNLSVDPGHPRRADLVLKDSSALVRAPTLPAARPGASTTTPGTDPWATNTPATNAAVAEADRAGNGNALTAGDFTPAGAAAAKQGLYALDKADQFNLLCIPPHTPEGSIEAALVDAGIAYCTGRRAMMIVDPPADWDSKEDAIAGVDAGVGTASANAALFFPRIVQQNPLRDNREEAFAPCGAIAGLIARIDGQRGVWKAPAGLDATLVNVPKLSVPLTDLENGELNPLGVNCLRALPGAGRVVWGARTRRGSDRLADQWKYIPVRRTALYIEESLYRGTQWVVFEPNDEPLWASIRLNIGAFLHGLFRQGAFQGTAPRDAYFVKCDKDTTLQADIDRGVVNIVVGFAPLKPAEFVVIRLQQIAGQIQA